MAAVSCSPVNIETYCINLLLGGSRPGWEPFFNEIVRESHDLLLRKVLYVRFFGQEDGRQSKDVRE